SFVDVIIGGMQPNLDKLVVAGDDAVTSAQFDDFYLGTGANSTVPVVLGQNSGPLSALVIIRANGQIQITWASGTLQSASDITGPWSNVTAATSSPYSFTPGNSQRFFRAAQ
ncbi:MAG: Laminin domain protein, partial [Verrucomicrobiales bacterium]|nr:Laminin domain protein [Verrucomicrobiales bacterium]